MIGLGVAYTWLVFKVSLLAAIVAVFYVIGGRGAGIRRGYLATAGLLCILGLSLSLFSPYPNWSRWESAVAAFTTSRAVPRGPERGLAANPPATAVPTRTPPVPAPADSPEPAVGAASLPNSVARNLTPTADQVKAEVRLPISDPSEASIDSQPPPTPPTTARQSFWVRGLRRLPNLSAQIDAACLEYPRLRWFFATLGVALATALGIGFARLVVALVSVAQFRRRLIPVTDARLLEGLDIVLAQTGCRIPVTLMTGHDLTSSATFGIRHPVILVPPDHAQWSDEQIQGVLAHEVGHVLHRDYLWWCLAQVVVVFHFFNPLVMRLVYWLRLQQELAADAVAVGVMGNPRRYLEVLASMAVREHAESLPLTARTFLPSQGTLASRIELLRSGHLTGFDQPLRSRGIWGLALTLMACLLAGLRLETNAGMQSPLNPLSRNYIPATSRFACAIQPRLLEHWPRFSAWKSAMSIRTLYGEPIGDYEQISAFRTRLADEVLPASQYFSGLILHCGTPEMARRVELEAAADFNGTLAGEWASLRLLPTRGLAVRVVEERLVIITTIPEELELCQAARAQSSARESWQRDWDGLNPSAIRIVLTSAGLLDWSRPVTATSATNDPSAPQLRPEWQEVLSAIDLGNPVTDALVLSLGGLDADAGQLTVSAAPGREMADVEQATLTLIQNLECRLTSWVQESNSPDAPGEPLGRWLGPVSTSVHEWARLPPGPNPRSRTWQGRIVWGDPVGPGIWAQQLDDGQGRVAARNLARAFQRFHAEHGRWPQTHERLNPHDPPHSWRVAILPYLGMGDLHRSYQFHKPWNDPSNLPVLAQMPDIFLSTGSPSASTRWIIPQRSPELSNAPRLVDGEVPEETEFLLLATPAVVIPWTMPDSISTRKELVERIRQAGAQAVLIDAEEQLIPQLFRPDSVGVR